MTRQSAVAVTDESLAHQGCARCAAPMAAPGPGDDGDGGRNGRLGGAWFDGQGRCLRERQYSIRGPLRGTLMRHYVCQRPLARTPALGTQGVVESPRAAALITPGRVALQRPTGRRCTPIGAIALAPVALAAHQNLHAAARAQEESGGLIGHGRLRQYRRRAGRGRPRVQQ